MVLLSLQLPGGQQLDRSRSQPLSSSTVAACRCRQQAVSSSSSRRWLPVSASYGTCRSISSSGLPRQAGTWLAAGAADGASADASAAGASTTLPAAGAGVAGVEGASSAEEVKAQLLDALQGLDRGIFGMKAAQRERVLALVERLEALNPLPNPAEHLEQVAGDWRLLFSTVSIQGSKRTRLGLREVVSLGELVQRIDVQGQTAVNEVQFAVRGLALLKGALTIEATYRPVPPRRVDIDFVRSTLAPDQLNRLFEKNYDMLLGIFNPEGWLDLTYVDASHRVGRDDKGNVFYLERCPAGGGSGD